MRGWVVATDPKAGEGSYFICHPDGPWIANFNGVQVEKIDGDPFPHPIVRTTEDKLTAGSAVRVYLRNQDRWAKAYFIAEVLGRRIVRFPGAGANDYPAEDVEPLGRKRITVDQMKEMREHQHLSIFEARKVLEGRGLLEELEHATTLDDLKPILEALILKQYPDPER